MKRTSILFFLALSVACVSSANSSLIGNWAFQLPDNYPVWLKIASSGEADLLWSIGRAQPVEVISLAEDSIEFSRDIYWKPYGREHDQCKLAGPMRAQLVDDGRLRLQVPYTLHGRHYELALYGTKMPPLPAAPNLSQVEFGEPVDLLASGMSGWKLTDPVKQNGWSIQNGVLVNRTPKTDHGAYSTYGNLRTVDEFEDFELSIEYQLPEGGNSGIYLRGAYEVQVVDRPGAEPSDGGPGSVYGRIRPSSNPSRAGGQWNHYRIVLVDRHITVEYNGERVIDNQPLEGCTGGGINSDDTAPGPLFLQGDHTTVLYRNIVLRPVLK